MKRSSRLISLARSESQFPLTGFLCGQVELKNGGGAKLFKVKRVCCFLCRVFLAMSYDYGDGQMVILVILVNPVTRGDVCYTVVIYNLK